MTGSKERRDQDPEPREPGVPPHQPAPEPEPNGVDEASEESFPSSDPPSTGMPAVSGRSRA